MIIRHLTALFHRERCERTVLIPMLEKLTEQEQQALWRLLQNVQDDAKRRGARMPWRHGVLR
jgi:hypothetical protein